MGDGSGGLALAIFVVMAAIVAGGFLLLFVIGRTTGSRLGLSGGRRLGVGVATGLAGLALGLLVVTATFFESKWAPPPSLTLSVPPGFEHRWVILLEDARAPTALVWRGSELPFQGLAAELAVPASGVLRVRSFGAAAGRADLDVRWSDGVTSAGAGGGPAPAGVGASSYLALLRGDPAPDDAQALPTHDPAAMAAYLRQREAG